MSGAEQQPSSLVDSLNLPPMIDVWAIEAKELTGAKPNAYVKIKLLDEEKAVCAAAHARMHTCIALTRVCFVVVLFFSGFGVAVVVRQGNRR